MALIHKFKQGDNFFVLDVNTGAVHIVDELVYDLVDDNKLRDKEELIKEFGAKYGEETISEAYEELLELIDEDILYSRDQYEDIAHSSMDDRDYIKAVCLNIIHGCNLRCKYCFADEGEYNGHKGVMGNIILSLDGRKEVNDNVRIKVDGSGSYDDILPNIKRMIEKRDKSKHYYVRGTFTGANTDFYEDVKAMVNEGFREISIEPVVLEKGHFLELKEEHLPEIFENYDKLYNEMARRKKEGDEFNFYHFNIDLNGGPCVYKRISGCGAGFEYVAITPQGEVYPCHQFVGKEEFKLGSIYDDTYDAELGKKFKKAHIYNKPKCRECWARFYCSGGCQSNNFAFNGDMNIPYEIGCKMQKKRIECAIALRAE